MKRTICDQCRKEAKPTDSYGNVPGWFSLGRRFGKAEAGREFKYEEAKDYCSPTCVAQAIAAVREAEEAVGV